MADKRQLEELVMERRHAECIAERDATRGQYAPDDANHRMWFRASTLGVKDDGIEILPAAWKKDIKAWLKKNPVFMPMHDYWDWSLGHGVAVEVDDLGLLIQIEFAYGRNPVATMAWDLYRAGDMNAVSVGWETIEYRIEERGEDDSKRKVMVVTRAKLLELSAVPLPMDEDALALRMRGLAEHDDVLARACKSFACLHCKECSEEKETAKPKIESIEDAEPAITQKPDRIAEVLALLDGYTEALADLRREVALIRVAAIENRYLPPDFKARLEGTEIRDPIRDEVSRIAAGVTLTEDECKEALKRLRTE
jgi:HK97 family phage prohead protease